mmetsp:Transcript_5233/g.8000  ORF Transcript_5233/g.8000 Transcript_5233/m.8000 type:complete len:173 (-) Transcript_5233:240-758(-)
MAVATLRNPQTGEHKSLPKSKSSDVKVVSPARSSSALERELRALRARNKVLANTLRSISEVADEHYVKNHDLVWFAQNRCRFPNHDKSKKLETSEDHREDIQKLRSKDGDYHHGMNCGVLATSRLFKEISDLSHGLSHVDDEKIIDHHEDIMQDHTEKVKGAKECFPNLSVN